MSIKFAIFDFDGTLYDTMYIWDLVGETYIRSIGLEPRPSLREDVRAMSLYQSACYLQKEYGVNLSVDQIIKGINQTIETFYINQVQPKAHAGEFLDQLRCAGIRMCIATATDRYLIEAALKRCGLDEYFEAIFTCSEVGQGKDQPDIFRRAMEYFAAERNECVVFEDAIHAAQTAKRDGFILAAVYDSSEVRQEELRQLADCYIADYSHAEEFWKLAAESDQNPAIGLASKTRIFKQ
ncbi:MAG: HAD family phosphatase [Lachnospiraceae bacterium]|nr:HAD family phosphatase [Lachnospiraceae bacterium]